MWWVLGHQLSMPSVNTRNAFSALAFTVIVFSTGAIAAAVVCTAPPLAGRHDVSGLNPAYRWMLATYRRRPSALKWLFYLARPLANLPPGIGGEFLLACRVGQLKNVEPLGFAGKIKRIEPEPREPLGLRLIEIEVEAAPPFSVDPHKAAARLQE